jgi:hypothetical protein
MYVISVAMIVAATLVGGSLPLKAMPYPPAVPVSADNLINMKDFDAISNKGPALDIAPLFN